MFSHGATTFWFPDCSLSFIKRNKFVRNEVWHRPLPASTSTWHYCYLPTSEVERREFYLTPVHSPQVFFSLLVARRIVQLHPVTWVINIILALTWAGGLICGALCNVRSERIGPPPTLATYFTYGKLTRFWDVLQTKRIGDNEHCPSVLPSTQQLLLSLLKYNGPHSSQLRENKTYMSA